MIYTAIVKDGGIFIPNLQHLLSTDYDIKQGEIISLDIAQIVKSADSSKINNDERSQNVRCMAGALKNYADPTKMALEESAIAQAIENKYGHY